MSQEQGGPPRSESFAQLAGHVGHDIVNMVTIVLTYAEHLSRKLDRDHPGQEDIREIRSAGERAAGLTRELLTCARSHASPLASVDVHDLLASLEARIRRIAGDSVKVEMTLGARGARVLGDRGDLEQTLINLAINARDAMPTGGILAITTSDVTEGLEVLVRDTGVGMDEATRRRVFEPFFTTKGSSGGTGLGLSLVAGVVRTMGGAIAVESVVGHGATFRISLPIPH
jgi:two-component system, cell cycle sensor histidine kinase and response regulator CckA